MEYRGQNGTITVEQAHLTLVHHGVTAKGGGLATSRPRRIALEALSAVELTDATRLRSGWLTLGIGGQPLAQVGVGTVGSSPDSVMFRLKDNPTFRSLHEWLTNVVSINRNLGVDPSAATYDPAIPSRLDRMRAKTSESRQAAQLNPLSRETWAPVPGAPQPEVARAVPDVAPQRKLDGDEQPVGSATELAQGPQHAVVEQEDRSMGEIRESAAGRLAEAAAAGEPLFGKKVTQDKALADLKLASPRLIAGERVMAYVGCNNFSPSTHAVVVTTVRIMGLNRVTGYEFMAALRDISVLEAQAKKRTVLVETAAGASMLFKDVAAENQLLVHAAIDFARRLDLPSELVTEAADAAEAYRLEKQPQPEEKQASKLVRSQERADGKQAKVQERAARKEERAREKAAKEAADLATYGRCVYSGSFGLRSVRMYELGFVRVGVPMFGSMAPFERLVTIESSADVGKKSGFGRAVGATATMGVSLASSNKRGDVWVTIVTDKNTHVLHEEPPTALNMRTAKKMEGAGRALLHQVATGQRSAQMVAVDPSLEEPAPAELGQTSGTEVSGGEPTDDLGARLQRLDAFKAQGLVTDDEYRHLRAKILEDI